MYDKTTFLSGLTMGLIGKGNPTFEGSDTFSKGYLLGAELRNTRPAREPVAYLYNGAVLPALPVEDTEKYPYVFLYTYNSRTYLNYHAYRPFFSYIRNEAGEFCVVNPNASYALENGAFTDRRENDRTNSIFHYTEDKLQLIWTNFDVLNDDGSVYMAAGYTNYPDAPPVPAETITDPCPDKSVMYLYDDASTDEVGDTVELPAIPEVDLRVYPYLWVRYASNKYSLMMSRHPIWYGRSPAHYSYCYIQESDNLNEWTYLGKYQYGYPTVWANYDVYDAYDFDRVAISATDPIPVYDKE